ncbi:hypothetical protein [Sphingobium ummariense]
MIILTDLTATAMTVVAGIATAALLWWPWRKVPGAGSWPSIAMR